MNRVYRFQSAIVLVVLLFSLSVAFSGCAGITGGPPQPNPNPLTITTSSLPAGQVQQSYQATIWASGGKSPYSWSIAAGSLPPGLMLNSATGQVSGTPSQAGTFSFTAQATDSLSAAATANLSIAINPPPNPLTITTTSSQLPTGTAGVAYPSTNLAASGGTPSYTWTLTSAASTFPAGLTLNNGGTISGTPTAAGSYNFTVQVKDSLNATATANLSITINSALAVTTSSLPTGAVATAYPATNLAATGGAPPYAWTLTTGAITFPPGLMLSRLGGISGTPTAAGTFHFTVQVTDSTNATGTANLSIIINPAPSLTIMTTALPNGTAGTAYPLTNLAATGGSPPYTWTLNSAANTFPAGLTLSSAGQISGTPTATGTYNFTVQAQDSLGGTATANLSIVINPASSSLAITTASSQLPTGTMNTAYPATNLAATGGTPPYAWTLASAASTFPAGLTLSNAGAISGTPTIAGTYNFTVKVTDSLSATASANLTIVINSGIWQPALVTSWQWQLTTPVDQTVNAQMYDIDMFDNDASVVASLHAQGRKVICYISAGTYENWRPDASSFPSVVLGNAVSGWPGENWLDIRRIDLLGPIMTARLDLCKSKGFDGVEPDNIDGYTNGTGFPLTAQDQINYNTFIAHAAHARGLSIALKNDVNQVQALLPYFDFALDEQCFEYSECSTLTPFISAGKAVFEVEYNLSTSQFCPQANAMNFNSMQKNLNLDAFRIPCR